MEKKAGSPLRDHPAMRRDASLSMDGAGTSPLALSMGSAESMVGLRAGASSSGVDGASPTPGIGLTIECSPRMGRSATPLPPPKAHPRYPCRMHAHCPSPLRSPRIQNLSLELGCGLSSRGVPIEDSWKGEILPDFLFLGDRVTASDLDRLTTLRITHILNCTEDVSNFFETSSPHLRYLRIPVNDRSEAAAEMASHFPRCVEFLDECRACGGRALVHCRAGVSRSATIVIGYLMQLQRWDLKASLHYVDKRRFVQPNSGFIQFLVGLEKE